MNAMVALTESRIVDGPKAIMKPIVTMPRKLPNRNEEVSWGACDPYLDPDLGRGVARQRMATWNVPKP
jgi:hypothetical protein